MKEVKDKQKTFTGKLAEKIDSFVSVFSPKAGLERKIYRNAMSRSTAYRSATTTRMNDDWIPTSGSADEDLLKSLPKLREKSRDLNRNNPYAAGITATVVTNVVGIGIRPQSRVDRDGISINEEQTDLFEKTAEKKWHQWVEFADAGRRLDFYGIQRLVERQILENGEVFIVPLMITTDESPYNLRLQVIEADRVDTPAELKSDKNVRSGIELDKNGRPVAYYVRNSHPGDMYFRRDAGNSIKNFTKIPARNELGRPNILHLYHVKRPGQTRGEPFFSPVMNIFRDLDDYMEAELVAAKVAACFTAFVKTSNPGALSFANTSKNTNGQKLETLEPGLINYLNANEDVTFADPKRPGSNFAPFVEQQLRACAAALNMPFEVVVRDFSRSNYSSVRAALQEARRFFKERQKFIERELCQPVWEMFIEEAYLNLDLPNVKFYQYRLNYTRARWISPGWGWIDPTKEVDAARSAIEGHMSTLADEAAAQGKDYEEVLEQLSKEKKKKKELGLIDTPRQTNMVLKDQKESVEGKEEDEPAGALK